MENEHIYDQPTAARMLSGVFGYMNEISKLNINTLHPVIDDESESVALFFNCKSSFVDEILSKPIPRDYAEISFG